MVDVPLNLRGEFELNTVRMTGDEQPGIRGEGEITRSVLDGVDLSETRLSPLVLFDTELRRVSLVNAKWSEVTAHRVELFSCQAVGIRLSCELLTDVYAQDCKFDYATLHVERIKGNAAFKGCSFRESVITGDLSGAVFLDCDFRETEFDVSKARQCDLRSSRLDKARGLITLHGAIVNAAQAVSAAAQLATEVGLTIEE